MMQRNVWAGIGAGLVLALLAETAAAHSFAKPYNLPVPVSLYLYGASAALAVSFLIIGYFLSRPEQAAPDQHYDLTRHRIGRALLSPRVWVPLRAIAVMLLLLTIITGLFGVNRSLKNFNMTFFWIIFTLGLTYLTAVIGNVYAVLNPWRVLCDWVDRLRPGLMHGRWAYPQRLGYWPATLLYFGFIWVELLGDTRPWSLSLVLIGYTALNLLGAWAVGRTSWFCHCELFAVFLRLIGRIAPLAYQRQAGAQPSGCADLRGGRLILRLPFVGLLQREPVPASLLMFVLFMLSSTAFDGFRETVHWVKFFWKDVYQFLAPYIGTNYVETFPTFNRIYQVYHSLGLLASPFVYLALYIAMLWLAKALTRTHVSVGELARHFALSLVPIALVYHVTHYYTLIVTQGQKIWNLFSDPLGLGWDLFGTAQWESGLVSLDPGVVWHTQVALILIGHIASVYLAHLVALRVFRNQREAMISQLPMLVLMVAYTAIGLWILSLPISAGLRS